MQINRLFEIIYLLLDKKSMTAQELADYFEVSKRTILRDIDTLALAKIPIYTTQGKGGGISLMEGFVLNKTALTENEQNQILIALQSLNATKYADSGDVLVKLGALFQKTNTDWIEVDFSRWGQGTSDNVKFDLLKRSIVNRTAVQFEYVSSYGENSIRKVYPLKLVFKSKAWYLQGFCTDKQDYRTFKINRILNVAGTDERFEQGIYIPPSIEETGTPINPLIDLELVFAPYVAYRVYDELDEGSIERADNGSLHVFARLPEDNWLYGFLMSFGKDVEILQPKYVKENLAKKLSIT
jgi:predicted DNA-binding transcriptional regulator YafY